MQETQVRSLDWEKPLEKVSEAQSKCKNNSGLVPGSKILGKKDLDCIVFSDSYQPMLLLLLLLRCFSHV